VSRKNNVNPDYYKVAGGDHVNEDASPTTKAEAGSPAPRRRKKGDGPPPNLIPGAPPVGERPEPDEERA